MKSPAHGWTIDGTGRTKPLDLTEHFGQNTPIDHLGSMPIQK
jgi:hypothetical protein